MRHSIVSEGFGVRLRPVTLEDAAFIVWLRNQDFVKGRLGDSAVDVTAQQDWLRSYFERSGDYYFVVETLLGVAVGTYGIYNIQGSLAETGRWVIRPGVPAAVPSGVVLFDIVFKQLGLKEIVGRTVATNRNVLSINRKFGFRQIKVATNEVLIGGKSADMVHFVLTPADWEAARERLLPLAKIAEPQILEWEKAQSAATPWC